METLEDSEWDVVISGTGLPQSLLALALSRSGKRILHVDRNGYYGGTEAALSLQDAETWTEAVNKNVSDQAESADREGSGRLNTTSSINFKDACIIPNLPQPASSKLGFSRSYSLALSPQLIYSRSALLPSLVSSKVYRQLEFLAVGSWWIYEADKQEKVGIDSEQNNITGRLGKIPGGREDVFADKNLDLRSKRSLMKFLRLAADVDAQGPVLQEWGDKTLQEFLTTQFSLSTQLQSALHALTLSLRPPSDTKTSFALPRITRHLTSIGVFGPGFGSVVPKWGGGAEISQVACRACAVGGAIYVLNKAVKHVESTPTDEEETLPLLTVRLQDGDKIRTKWIIGGLDDVTSPSSAFDEGPITYISRSISIVSSCLPELFSLTAEGAPPPAATIVVFPSGSIFAASPPVYLSIHSSDTGECPTGQCVVYGITILEGPAGSELLNQALHKFRETFDETARPDILWELHYSQRQTSSEEPQLSETLGSGRIITLPASRQDIAFEDSLLRNVKEAWSKISAVTKGFMQFEDREAGAYDDDGEY